MDRKAQELNLKLIKGDNKIPLNMRFFNIEKEYINAVCENKKFTLIELLVVIALIGILLSILLPSLKRGRIISVKAVCLSNVSQVNKLFMVNSLNHGRKIFEHDTENTAVNPWDLPTALWHELGEPPRDTFYCPLRPERNTDKVWNWSGKITGYSYMFKRQAGLPSTLSSYEWVDLIDKVSAPSENPLVADTVIFKNGKHKNTGISPLNSSHFPEGHRDMNINYTDGHSKLVRWGSFSHQMNAMGREIWW